MPSSQVQILSGNQNPQIGATTASIKQPPPNKPPPPPPPPTPPPKSVRPPPPPPPPHHLPHHHHHHHLANQNVQLSASSSLSSLQPVDQNSSAFHRCNMSNSSATPSISGHSNGGDSIATRPLIVNHCGHIYKPSSCSHHHSPANFCDHHLRTIAPSQPAHSCVNVCHLNAAQHNCHSNLRIGKSCPANMHNHHHCPQDLMSCRASDIVNNECALATAHSHNLSNSSTTTHTSNVAVKYQPQSQRPGAPRSGCGDPSQHFDQYGLSSAASTSSATASLSSYHRVPTSFEDFMPLYPPCKVHQPLPPPLPPPPPTQNLRAKPQSPVTQQILFNNNNNGTINSSSSVSNSAINMASSNCNITASVAQGSNNNPMSTIINSNSSASLNSNGNNGSTMSSTVSNGNNGPIITTKFLNTPSQMNGPHQHVMTGQTTLPPLPPKPTSNHVLPSNKTQITTVAVASPSLITRVTSQAGVQNPLPSSDVPPPLPPLNHGSRANQPQTSSLMTRSQNATTNDTVQQIIAQNNSNPLAGFANLSLNRSGPIMTDAERKTEALTRQVELELEQQQLQKASESLGLCSKCGDKVTMSQAACKAMNQIYHASCFICSHCARPLLGKTFYPIGDKVYCEQDFKHAGSMQSLEKCAACLQPIYNMILPAMGKYYHPECFKCCVCDQCLDGVPFTIDMKNKIYCVKDYHNLYSPKCAACGKSITPIDGTEETVRVVSMDKDYHIDCYCCEDCRRQLTDEPPNQSYPLGNHLLCQRCHIIRLSKMQAGLNLS